MSTDSDPITRVESETLEFESLAARGLDQQLARELRRELPAGTKSSAGYLRGLSDRPRLPPALERRLIRAAQGGDPRAREELVEAFLPLIAGVARLYRGSTSITRVELLQEGVVGLLRALERFDPTLGVPFWGLRSSGCRSRWMSPITGPEGELGAFGELLADPLASDAYEQLLHDSEIEQVRALLGSLSERERGPEALSEIWSQSCEVADGGYSWLDDSGVEYRLGGARASGAGAGGPPQGRCPQ